MAKSDLGTVKSGATPASTVTWDDDVAKADDMKVDDLKVETAAVDPAAGDPDLDLAEEPADDVALADDSQPAMGGPLEDATTGDINMAAADLATRPATQNYPPCRPGPGDDNCIQLYEPGVETALGQLERRPTGGLAGETDRPRWAAPMSRSTKRRPRPR